MCRAGDQTWSRPGPVSSDLVRVVSYKSRKFSSCNSVSGAGLTFNLHTRKKCFSTGGSVLIEVVGSFPLYFLLKKCRGQIAEMGTNSTTGGFSNILILRCIAKLSWKRGQSSCNQLISSKHRALYLEGEGEYFFFIQVSKEKTQPFFTTNKQKQRQDFTRITASKVCTVLSKNCQSSLLLCKKKKDVHKHAATDKEKKKPQRVLGLHQLRATALMAVTSLRRISGGRLTRPPTAMALRGPGGRG